MSRWRRLRARDRRAVILGLVVLLPAAGYRLGFAPWWEYRTGLRDALVAERDLYARERAAIREGELHPDLESELRTSLSTAEPWLLDAATTMGASGHLSRHVTGLGRSAAILIQEIQSQESESAPGMLRTTSVNVRALGDLEGFSRFLHAIENGSLLLEVSELTLRPAGVNDGDLERGQLMSAGMVITAFWMEDLLDPTVTPTRIDQS